MYLEHATKSQILILEFVQNNFIEEKMLRRLGDGISSMAAELHFNHEGFQPVFMKDKDVYDFVDNQSASMSLNSKATRQHSDVRPTSAGC